MTNLLQAKTALLLLQLLVLPCFLVTAKRHHHSHCDVPLHKSDDACIKSCMEEHGHKHDTYVCDLTVGFLHHIKKKTEWRNATPPKGSDVHEYAVYQGDPPCDENGPCDGCFDPPGTELCSVLIDSETCDVAYDEEEE